MSDKDYISIHKVPELIMELTGVARAQETIYAWCTRGRISASGSLVKLKTIKRLGRLYTTKEWVETFIQEVG